MKKTLLLLLTLALGLSLCGCGKAASPAPAAETRQFTDDCGRTVELPAELRRVSPSGAVANMLLAAAAPERMVSLSDTLTESQTPYLPAELASLPVTGSLYGGKGDANLEAILAAAPQLIIDMGDLRDSTAASLDALQTQTGIPCVFLRSDLPHMAAAFRSLGLLLPENAERCAELADYAEETVALANETAARIPEERKLRVIYTSGADGLSANARGSTQAQVIELVGGINAVELPEISQKNGGSLLNFEQLYLFDPDVILFAPGSIYESVSADPAWAELDAIRSGRYYRVPGAPYNWLSMPPSMNMLPGIRWLGRLLYPDYYDLDPVSETQRAFRLLWNYDLSAEAAEALLADSLPEQ